MSDSALLRQLAVVGSALLVAGLLVAGCGSSNDETSGGGSGAGGGGGGGTIALLLPENETPRYETNDKPGIEKAVSEKCPNCEVIYFNAGGDAEKQQSQG